MLEGGGLAFTLRTVYDIDLRIGGQQLVGVVVASVGDPHDTELVFGVVECSGVFHFLCDDIFLIISTNHEGHRGQLIVTRLRGFTRVSREEPLQPDDGI